MSAPDSPLKGYWDRLMFKFDFYDFTAPLDMGAQETRADITFAPLSFETASAQSKAPIVAMQALGDGDDYAGDTSTTGVIEVDGQAVAVRYDVGDDGDWLAFDTEAGEFITFTLLLDYANLALNNLNLRVFNSNGDNIFTNSSHSHVLHFLSPDTGRYYVEVDYLQVTQTEFLLSANRSTDDYSADINTAAYLEGPNSVIYLSNDSLVMDEQDEDWVAVSFGAYDFVQFEFVGSNVRFGLQDSKGNQIEFTSLDNISGGFFVEEAGTYYYSAEYQQGLFGYRPGGFLSYAILPPEYPGDASTFGVINIDGAPTQSQLEQVGDVDWFAVTAEAGDAVNFEVTDRGFTNVQMRLVDANGNNIEGFDFGNYGPNLNFTHEFVESGTYYLQVREAWDAWAGSYEITATQINNPIVGDLNSENEIEGTAYNDVIFGGNLGDRIFGLEGDDIIYGNGGDDFLFGGLGNDSLYAGGGSSRLYGGDGDDQLFATQGDSLFDVRLVGGTGNDRITVATIDPGTEVFGDDGDDIITATGFIERIDGGAGNDIINLQGEATFIFSGSGDDVVRISSLPDSGFFSGGEVFGGAGYDRLELIVDTFDASQTFGIWGVFNRDVFNYEFAEIIQWSSSGEILGRTTLSGSKTIQTEFDVDSVYPWARRVFIEDSNPNAAWQSKEFFYDDNNNIISINTDNGANIVTYDLANRFDWTYVSVTNDIENDNSYQRLENFYDDNGNLIRQKILSDTGEFSDEFFDVSNTQNYQMRELTYTSEGGDLAEIDTLFDTGRRNIVTYDTDNSELEWDLRSETQDLADTATWSSVTSYYIEFNGALAKTRFVVERDNSYTSDEVYTVQGPFNGASVRTLTDTANNQSWDSWVYEYNAARQVEESIRTNDNGIVTTLTYDRDGDFEWATRTRNQDTEDIFNWVNTDRLVNESGETMLLEINYDDGVNVVNEYDLDAAYAWARKVTRTEADGDMTEFYYDDDGVLYDTVVI